jgi:hypothetical protein
MNPDATLFDLPAAHRARAAGQERAAAAEGAWSWGMRAHDVIAELARSGAEFTVDDLTSRIGLPSAGTNANNAVGAVFSSAAKRGEIVRVGYRPSRRVVGHGRVVAIWTGAPDWGRP